MGKPKRTIWTELFWAWVAVGLVVCELVELSKPKKWWQ